MGEVEAMKGTVPKAGFDRRRDSLDFLIEPVERATFLETFYERLPLIAARNDPHRYADLLTLEKLDHFIASADLKEGMVELTRHKDPIPTDAYVDERGRVSGVSVVEHYLKGATIILPRLHDSMFELGEFCRSLEEIFSCHVQTNIYLTPSANQGFATHYDNHDVFVMQISGAKKWRLYDTPVAIPYRGEGFEPGQHEAGEVSAEFILSPGECVYVPRGLMHDAQNEGDEPSLHITVGLITKTWADLLLESISELALEDPDFRRSLPPGFASRDFDREPARRHFERLKSAIAAKAGMDGAFDLLVPAAPDEEDVVALANKAEHFEVDLAHQWAGRVDDPQAARFRRLHDRRRDAVGAEDREGPFRHFVQLVDEDGPEVAQAVDDKAVMDDFLADIDGGLKPGQGQLHDLYRAIHTGAVAPRVGQKHFHPRIPLKPSKERSPRLRSLQL